MNSKIARLHSEDEAEQFGRSVGVNGFAAASGGSYMFVMLWEGRMYALCSDGKTMEHLAEW